MFGSLTPVSFKIFDIRLNGKVYTSNSTAFKEALNKHKMWEKLNDIY